MENYGPNPLPCMRIVFCLNNHSNLTFKSSPVLKQLTILKRIAASTFNKNALRVTNMRNKRWQKAKKSKKSTFICSSKDFSLFLIRFHIAMDSGKLFFPVVFIMVNWFVKQKSYTQVAIFVRLNIRVKLQSTKSCTYNFLL